MSVWTHISGIISIKSYDFPEDSNELISKVEKAIENSNVPFGSEGKISDFVMVQPDKDLVMIMLNGDLRDVGKYSDMSKNEITSKSDYIKEWLQKLPTELNNFGVLKTLLVEVSTDDNQKYSEIYYNVDHPDLLTPDIIICQRKPHHRALNTEFI